MLYFKGVKMRKFKAISAFLLLFPASLLAAEFRYICLKDNYQGTWNLFISSGSIYGRVKYSTGCTWLVEGSAEGQYFSVRGSEGKGGCCETGYAEWSFLDITGISAQGFMGTECNHIYSDVVFTANCE
jgi:hypothetical protein